MTLYQFMLGLITIYFMFVKEGGINIVYMVLQKGPKGYEFSDFWIILNKKSRINFVWFRLF